MDDQIDFRKNGHIVASFGDATYDLRRPSAGELLDVRTKLIDLSEQRKELAELNEAVAEEVDPSLPEEEREEAATRRRAAFKELRKADTQREVLQWDYDAYGGWLLDVFELLGTEPRELTRDGLPAWMFEGEVIARMIAHWRAVPLARGN